MTNLIVYSPEQVSDAQKTLTLKPLSLLPKEGPLTLIERAKSDPGFRDELVAECKTVIAANMPANEGQIVGLIQRLLNHYKVAEMGEDDFQAVLEDWIEDLAGISQDILAAAMGEYRRSPKGRFRPASGDILELTRNTAGFRMQVADRAKRVLEALQ